MQNGWIEKEEVEFPVLCHLVAREFTIRWQHLIFIIMYMVQLYKEDWGILCMLGCWAVALPQYQVNSEEMTTKTSNSTKTTNH